MHTAISVRAEGDRTYLEGVEPLSWGTGEMCEFASALTRMLRCAGEEVPYHYVMGVTGVAFRFTFGAELWNPGFYGFASVAADEHDLIRRAFASVGYGYHLHPRGDQTEDVKRIARSLANGAAVMLEGCVVDASDWVLITGADGDALLGVSPYSPFGKGERFKDYDVIRDWHPKTVEYIILGERAERPPEADIYSDALRLAEELVRTPHVADRITGLRGYEVLAAALREEEYSEETLGWRYLCLLCYNMMLDDHRSAAPFLRDAAEALPRWRTELHRAADCYERSCELRDRLEDLVPSNFSEEAQKRVLDPNVRDEYARVILEIRDIEESGVSCVEQALAVSSKQERRF